MGNLIQSETSLTYYQGWYGTLSETSEDLCETLKLVLGDSTTGFSKAYPEILNVFETGLNEFEKPTIQITYNGNMPDFLLGNSPLKEMKCGHSYLIVLKKGTETIPIPQFTFANTGTTGYEYKIRATI